ncbi:MAG: hypothetical protein NT045_09235 [Candidatus Aureabacteria bacterium]|nr:hypothetical protein [Candidatus Auribacterota bacterium]
MKVVLVAGTRPNFVKVAPLSIKTPPPSLVAVFLMMRQFWTVPAPI